MPKRGISTIGANASPLIVIDGVAGAQFTQFLSTVLTDIRHILL